MADTSRAQKKNIAELVNGIWTGFENLGKRISGITEHMTQSMIYGRCDDLMKECAKKSKEITFEVTSYEVASVNEVKPRKTLPPFYITDTVKTPTLAPASIKSLLGELKNFYRGGCDRKEALEKFRKKMGPNYDERFIEGILTQYMIEKDASSEYISKKLFQPIITISDIASKEEMKRICGMDFQDVKRYLIRSGIEPADETIEAIDTFAAYFEIKRFPQEKAEFTSDMSRYLGLKKFYPVSPIVPESIDSIVGIRLNHNPTEAELHTAAIYYSNVLAQHEDRYEEQMTASGSISIDHEREHNNLMDVAMFTGIKPSKIRSYARKLERDKEAVRTRIANYGYSLSDLDSDTRISIYEDMQTMQDLEVVAKYNLVDSGVAKRAYRAGERLAASNPKL